MSAIARPHLRRLLVATTTLGLLAAASAPASAGAPTREPFTMLSLSCNADSDLGPVTINLSHSSTGAGAPGGDIVVWAPGHDPEEDLPVLSGYEEAIDREDGTLRGTIPLRGPGGEPGYGLADGPGAEPGDVVGYAVYEVSFDHAGPSTSQVHRGHVVDGGRTNQRYTNRQEHTPVIGAGTLELPGAAPVRLEGCVGSEVAEQVTVTAPETIVTSRRDPVGFACTAEDDGTEVWIQVTGGEAALVVVPLGGDEPIASGSTFVDETRSAITAAVPMSDRDGTDLGEATLQATPRVVDREVVRHDGGGSTSRTHLEHLAIVGSVAFAGETYRFEGCDAVRVREHTVAHDTVVDRLPVGGSADGPRGRRV